MFSNTKYFLEESELLYVQSLIGYVREYGFLVAGAEEYWGSMRDPEH